MCNGTTYVYHVNAYMWFTSAVGDDNNVKPALVAPVCPPKAVSCVPGNDFDKVCCEKRRNQKKRRTFRKLKSYLRKGWWVKYIIM